MAFKTRQQYLNIIEKNNGIPFHEWEAAKKKLDPENKPYQEAISNAKTFTDRFMGKVRDYTHPEHEQALNTYLTKYGRDESKVHADSISVACNLKNAAPYELKDPAIEFKIFATPGIITSADDLAFHNKFKDLAALKIKAEGYSGMDECIKEFWDKHPLGNVAPGMTTAQAKKQIQDRKGKISTSNSY